MCLVFFKPFCYRNQFFIDWGLWVLSSTLESPRAYPEPLKSPFQVYYLFSLHIYFFDLLSVMGEFLSCLAIHWLLYLPFKSAITASLTSRTRFLTSRLARNQMSSRFLVRKLIRYFLKFCFSLVCFIGDFLRDCGNPCMSLSESGEDSRVKLRLLLLLLVYLVVLEDWLSEGKRKYAQHWKASPLSRSLFSLITVAPHACSIAWWQHNPCLGLAVTESSFFFKLCSIIQNKYLFYLFIYSSVLNLQW